MSFLYLYDAAAGAGKTHALVSYYILQLLKNPDHFGRILAITFTNMATQEMKERIVLYLHQLTQSPTPAWAEEIRIKLDYRSDELTEKAEKALGNILHHYHDFAVMTIDSFFDRVTRSFQREHQLGTAYTLELDQNSVLTFCLQELMATLSDFPFLEKQLTHWTLTKLQEGAQWDVGKEIIKIGDDMLKRSAANLEQKQNRIDQKGMNMIFDDLVKRTKEFREQLRDEAANMGQIITRAGLSAEDFSWGKQGVVGFLEKVAQGQQLIPTQRVRNAVEGRWEKKKGERAAIAFELVEGELRSLLINWLEVYDGEASFYHTVQAMLPLRYAFAIAQRMQELTQKYERENDRLLMAHLPLLLYRTMNDVSPAALFWKMGSEYDRFLIDELQDVSQSQWKNLAPLLQASIASQHESLLVGDVKQSIYRWRGGDPVIFLKGVSEDLGNDVVQRKALAYNWRSGETIVEFNNSFFQEAARMVTNILTQEVGQHPDVDQAMIQKEIAQINLAYQQVQQAIPDRSNFFPAGCVEVMLLPTKKEEEPNYHWKEKAIEVTIQKIEKLQENGYAPQDIALLVRDHAEAKSLLKGLMAYRQSEQAKIGIQYEATTTNGLTIHQHPTIIILVAALRYLENSEDQQAFATLRYYYPLIKNQEIPSESWDPHECFSMCGSEGESSCELPSDFQKQIHKLKHMPLDSLVTKLILLFDLLKHHEGQPYLASFQEVVHDFLQTKQGGIAGFLNGWDEFGQQVKLPSQDGNTLKIITIHQSKGLAFPAVLLPFAAWRLDHSPYHPPMLWCQSEDNRIAPLGEVPIYYGKKLKETLFAPFYFQEKWRVYLEQLNLLYVALTRPIDYLGVMAPTSSQSEKLTTVANIVEQLTNKHYTMSNTGCVTLGSMVSKEKKTVVTDMSNLPTNQLKYTLDHQNQLCTSIAPIAHDEGTWWHTLLANILKQEDLGSVLATYQARGELTAASAKKIESTLKACWQDDRVASWFSGTWKVKIEVPILLPDGKVVRLDRVMIQEDHAVVLDFKTGVPKKSDQGQVDGYVRILKGMGYKKVEGYLLYVNTASLVPVVM